MKHWIVGKPRNGSVQFFRYFFVGASSAVVDLVAYAIFLYIMEIHYLIAAFLAYMCGLTWNYTTSLMWVFESKHNRFKEIGLVFLVAMGGLFWTELLLWIAVHFGGYHEFWAKCVVLWIVLIWNFGMRKLFIFH